MNDPYAVLGVSPSASEEEVKKAYRELVKKYHPDNYVNNPLADLAEAKMKEVNEAYDLIVKQRTQGGYQSSSRSGGYSGGYQSNGYSGQDAGYRSPVFNQVRQLINQNNLMEAERILRSNQTNTAEWYFLMGSIAYRKGWMDEARQNFWTASSMEPGNLEYRQAVNNMNMQASRGTYGGGNDMAQLCTTVCCMNMLCDMCTGCG